MSHPTPDDVLAGVRAAWDASTLPALVPGGLHHGRAPSGRDAPEPPYAVATVKEGEREWFSGKAYVQPFTVTVRVWDAAPSPSTATVRRALEDLLDAGALAVPNADDVLHVKPAGGELQLDPKPRESNNVLAAAGSWEVLVQGSRP